MDLENILVSSYNQVIIESKNPCGKYGWLRNNFKVHNKRNCYVKISGEKIYLKDLKQLEKCFNGVKDVCVFYFNNI